MDRRGRNARGMGLVVLLFVVVGNDIHNAIPDDTTNRKATGTQDGGIDVIVFVEVAVLAQIIPREKLDFRDRIWFHGYSFVSGSLGTKSRGARLFGVAYGN